MTTNEVLFLKKLSECFAPSGLESNVSNLIKDEISSYVDSIETDPVGNLIATVGNGGTTVIVAHMDEVGFMITGIREDGTLCFQPVGGINPELLPSKAVLVGPTSRSGIIGAKPIHLSRQNNQKLTYSDLYIDIGATSYSDAKKCVSIGDFAVFDTSFEIIGSNKRTFIGKALDNRIGCFILTRLIKSKMAKNATFVFSTCEENGLRGATTFLSAHPFENGIALDTTTPNDLPGIYGADRVCSLGSGGVIPLIDGRTVYDRKMILSIFERLEREQIPHQTKSKRAGGNDAGAIQSCGLGAKTVCLSTPCRYIHGPVGIALEEDVESTYLALNLLCRYFGV